MGTHSRTKRRDNASGRELVSTIALLAMPLTGCGGGGSSGQRSSPSQPASPTAPVQTPSPSTNPTAPPPPPGSGDPMVSPLMVASNWEIGPIINGQNYSIGMPLHPTQTPDGWAFNIPLWPGSVHYVTCDIGSLAGKSHIVMTYRVEADAGVEIFATTAPGGISIGPTLYLQRRDDDWISDTYRWWDSVDARMPIKQGEYQLDIPLDGRWTSVMGTKASDDPQSFATAIELAQKVGFTLGGGTGYGHGVYANGNARMIVTSFKVE